MIMMIIWFIIGLIQTGPRIWFLDRCIDPAVHRTYSVICSLSKCPKCPVLFISKNENEKLEKKWEKVGHLIVYFFINCRFSPNDNFSSLLPESSPGRLLLLLGELNPIINSIVTLVRFARESLFLADSSTMDTILTRKNEHSHISFLYSLISYYLF